MLWFFLFLTLLTPLESEVRQPPSDTAEVSVVETSSNSSDDPTLVGPCEGGSDWYDENPTK